MLTKAKTFLARLHRDEQGAMAVEKILLLALIALPIIVVLYMFRNDIIGWFNDEKAKLQP